MYPGYGRVKSRHYTARAKSDRKTAKRPVYTAKAIQVTSSS